MRLSPDELSQIVAILEKIDEGLVEPRFPDRIGRFLRQYRTGRSQLDEVLGRRNVERRKDSAISGDLLGPVEIQVITEPRVSVRGFPLGEVADSLVFSEELGALINLALWLKGPIANSAYNLVRNNYGLRMSADYRWTPPSRLTPGEARIERSGKEITWTTARCLKAVADDIERPPHALEYILDYQLGPPGLKYFRCVAALKNGANWIVLPALGRPASLEVAMRLPKVGPGLRSAELVSLLIYREPWSTGWTIVDGKATDGNGAYEHVITWADFQKEIDGGSLTGDIISGIHDSLRATGLPAAESVRGMLSRNLLPLARDVLRWLHGSP